MTDRDKLMKNTVGCLAVFISGLLVTTSVRAQVPDTAPGQYRLDLAWPAGGLDTQHPPFIYDYDPDHVVSKGTFAMVNCSDRSCRSASGFFIDTDRDDDKVCAMTAGHVVRGIFELNDPGSGDDSSEVVSSEVESSEDESARITSRMLPLNFLGVALPGETTVALNYKRLNPQEQKVSFFGSRMPPGSIQVVRSLMGSPASTGIRQDLALLLIDVSRLKGRSTMSTLPYAYAAEGSVPEGRLVVKGHPKSWPLHRSDIHSTIAHSGEFNLSAVAHGAMSEGASGGPWAYNESHGTAFAVHSCGANCHDAQGQPIEGISGSFLTPLKAEIEATCKPSKKKKYVFLTSVVKPITAFLRGFTPPGKNRDVLAHVSGASCLGPMADTAFISTTSGQDVAYDRALAYASAFPGEEVYVYKIRADEKFYNAKASLQDSLKHAEKTSVSILTSNKADFENEYLFLDDVTFQGIPSSNIASAFLFKKRSDGKISHQWISNVNFNPADTTTSTFSYVGPSSSQNNMNLTWMTKVGNAAPNGSCLMSGSIPESATHFPAEALFRLRIDKEL